jgi:hypothetical protein
LGARVAANVGAITAMDNVLLFFFTTHEIENRGLQAEAVKPIKPYGALRSVNCPTQTLYEEKHL